MKKLSLNPVTTKLSKRHLENPKCVIVTNELFKEWLGLVSNLVSTFISLRREFCVRPRDVLVWLSIRLCVCFVI